MPKWLASLGMTGQDLLRQVSDLGYQVFLIGDDGGVGQPISAGDIHPGFHSPAVLLRATK
jgi:hypothetical protein